MPSFRELEDNLRSFVVSHQPKMSDVEQRIQRVLDRHFWMTHTPLATSLIAKEISAGLAGAGRDGVLVEK